MPEVVAERDGLDEVFVEPECLRGGPGGLGDLEGVHEAGPVVVALRREEDLGLVLEPAEGLAVYNPVAVAHVGGADVALFLRHEPAARVPRPHGEWAQGFIFPRFKFFPDHRAPPLF